uniref:Uncharacterized protein n=1 Tax=Rhizophora mucronata TaxID=61149 RepID=A0A2P2N276_RHIMU
MKICRYLQLGNDELSMPDVQSESKSNDNACLCGYKSMFRQKECPSYNVLQVTINENKILDMQNCHIHRCKNREKEQV